MRASWVEAVRDLGIADAGLLAEILNYLEMAKRERKEGEEARNQVNTVGVMKIIPGARRVPPPTAQQNLSFQTFLGAPFGIS